MINIKQIILIAFLIQLSFQFDNDFVIEQVDRRCEMKSRFTKYTTAIIIKNQAQSAQNSFKLAVDSSQKNNLVLLNVFYENQLLKTKQSQMNDKHIIYEVQLNQQIKSGEIIRVTVHEQYYNRMKPLPKQIKVDEDQFLEFYDNVYYLSPYVVQSQKTTYVLRSKPIFATQLDEKDSHSGPQVKYGPFVSIEPFSYQQIRLHFENNEALAIFKKIVKTIEVSHWGNIAIDEECQLANEGAALTGEFGRVDYTPSKPNAGKSALKGLYAELPYHARWVYYHDEVGNISNSHAIRLHDQKMVRLQIWPRYPLFGSWKANFHYGYNLPLHHYLFQQKSDENKYELQQLFGFPFAELLAEEYEIRVILPEGAKDIKASIPFEVDSIENQITHGILDTQGRPTLVIKKRLVTDFHYQPFKVNYTFTNQDLAKEILLIFGGFLAIFMTIIFVKRLSFKSLNVKQE